ncbi:MAG: DUF192 domain-containing protein [Alphaproteobacteria bacterium]|nr:DUF192 domain-containing protein [Alphaproteobacteria bacterium]
MALMLCAALPAALNAAENGAGMIYRRLTVDILAPNTPAPAPSDTPWLTDPATPKRLTLAATIRDPKPLADAGWSELNPFAKTQALILPYDGTAPVTLRMRGNFPESDALAIDTSGTVIRIYRKVLFSASYVETDIPVAALMLLPAGAVASTGIAMGDRVQGPGLSFKRGKSLVIQPTTSGLAIQPPPSTLLPR